MKKYLMMAVAGLAIASCSKMDDYATSPAEIAQAKYNQAFLKYVGGYIDPNQTWGFSDDAYSNAPAFEFTRAAMPATPNFRDTNPITKPTMPSYSNTVPTGAKYARDHQNYNNGDIIYINTDYQQLNNPQNYSDLTIYVDGNVTYNGQTNQNGNGTTICVTEGSTLKLGSVSERLTVYLAPNATLDVTQALNWDGTPAIDWQGNPYPLTFTKENAALYMSEGSKVKGTNIYFKDGYTVLNDGGSIEANNLTLDQKATLWNEGSIKVANALTLMNTSPALYNKEGKTIETVNLDLINNDALLFNEGTVKATGNIVLHNTTAEIVNYGTLSGASFSSAAGGKMHNEGTGTVNITGKTDLTNSNSSWMNDGHWTCGSFDVDNYSNTNINNCYLTVNGQFHLNRGTFVLGAESGVVCNSFAWEDTSDFYLGSKSVLKINGDLVTNNANSGYGFRGNGNDYAVIEAASIKHNGNEQFRMSYYGKLYIATDNHFEQWYKDAPNTNQPAYWYQSTVKFKFNGDTTKPIPSTNCNPGYTPSNPPTTPPTDDNSIRIVAEDLSAAGDTDFDFNDVVLDVTFGNPATVILTHAGGTLPLRINGNDANEVHKLFGVWQGDDAINENTPLQQMVNTGKGPNKPSVNLTNVLNVSISSRSEADSRLKLEVYKNGSWIEMTSPKGEPACKLAVGQDFKVLGERQSIKGTYPNFLEWVKNSTFSSQWWK